MMPTPTPRVSVESEVRLLAEQRDITSAIRRTMVFWVRLVVPLLAICWNTSWMSVRSTPIGTDIVMAMVITITITIVTTGIVEAGVTHGIEMRAVHGFEHSVVTCCCAIF